MKKIKTIILFVVSGIILQGCYTILDLPDYYAEDYESYSNDESSGETAPPVEILIGTTADYISTPIVTISNPTTTKYRNNDLEKQRTNENIRNDGGRSSDNNTKYTRTDSHSNSNSSSTSNNNSSRSSSDIRNSANGRR